METRALITSDQQFLREHLAVWAKRMTLDPIGQQQLIDRTIASVTNDPEVAQVRDVEAAMFAKMLQLWRSNLENG